MEHSIQEKHYFSFLSTLSKMHYNVDVIKIFEHWTITLRWVFIVFIYFIRVASEIKPQNTQPF